MPKVKLPLGINPGEYCDLPIRLLIVDDRAPAREGLKALLSAAGGYQDLKHLHPIVIVGEACDGMEALILVKKQQPDVVLMDVRMPGLNGLETLRLIKAGWPGVRVILMSFYGFHRTEALLAGADSFLLKGCSPDELLKEIGTIGFVARAGVETDV